MKSYNIGKEVKAFVLVAFLLLSVLFGMIISSFIFGFMSPTTTQYPLVTFTVTNETGFINVTGDVLNTWNSVPGYTNPIITSATNATGSLIAPGNYTLNQATGVVLNASAANYSTAIFNYTYQAFSSLYNTVATTQNNSVGAIQTYSNGASSQFNVISLVIILALLLGVFWLFWKIFVAGKKGGSNGMSYGSNEY